MDTAALHIAATEQGPFSRSEAQDLRDELVRLAEKSDDTAQRDSYRAAAVQFDRLDAVLAYMAYENLPITSVCDRAVPADTDVNRLCQPQNDRRTGPLLGDPRRDELALWIMRCRTYTDSLCEQWCDCYRDLREALQCVECCLARTRAAALR